MSGCGKLFSGEQTFLTGRRGVDIALLLGFLSRGPRNIAEEEDLRAPPPHSVAGPTYRCFLKTVD